MPGQRRRSFRHRPRPDLPRRAIQRAMRFLFLNQYFPPDPAPTGVLLRELGDELERLGHEVEYVAAGQSYREGQGQRGRMRRELEALAQMLLTGLRTRR